MTRRIEGRLLDKRVLKAFRDAGVKPPKQYVVDRIGFTPAQDKVLSGIRLTVKQQEELHPFAL